MADKKRTLTKREANKIDVHRRILKASRRLFASKGYDETMMRDIAKKADVSKATVYNYFPNKESLLIGTLDGAIDEAISTAESKKDLLPSDRLRAAIETFILGGMKYPDLTRRIIYLNSTEGSALYGSFSRIYDIFNDLITQAKEDGEFDIDNVDLVADITHYCIKGLEVPYIYGRIAHGMKEEDTKPQVAKIVYSALGKRKL